MTADWAICAKNSSEFEPADSMSAAMQAFRSESRRECTGLNWSGLVHPATLSNQQKQRLHSLTRTIV